VFVLFDYDTRRSAPSAQKQAGSTLPTLKRRTRANEINIFAIYQYFSYLSFPALAVISSELFCIRL
jgi:hypothetical protein